jgi:hypothetical protein
VAHTGNPSYLEDRDQDNCSSKPAWENTRETLKKGLVEWFMVYARFSKPSTQKKKKKKKKGLWNGSKW